MTPAGTDQGALLGRGISFPMRIDRDGRVGWSSGAENIREAIRVVLMTDPNERLMLPSFGAGSRGFLFEPNVPATHRLIQERITHMLTRWEPRIELLRVSVDEDEVDVQQANITVEYKLVATDEHAQLDLTVRLAG